MALFSKSKVEKASLLFNGDTLEFTNSFLIGRSVQCDLELSDSQVSRTHISLTPDPLGNWWLIDLGSTNGTFLNFRKVQQSTILKNGDRIQIAKKNFFFQCSTDNIAKDLLHIPLEEEKLLLDYKDYLFMAIRIYGTSRTSENYNEEYIQKILPNWQSSLEKEALRHDGEIALPSAYAPIIAFEKNNESAKQVLKFLSWITEEKLTKELDYQIVIHHGKMSLGDTAPNGYEKLIGRDIHFCQALSESTRNIGHRMLLTKESATQFVGKKINLLGDFKVLGQSDTVELFTIEVQ